MKRNLFLFSLLIVISIMSCNTPSTKTGGEYNIDNPANAENPDESNNGLPSIDFEDTEFNFGTVIQGEKVSHSFVFKNNGDGNLIISNVKASCGCTVPKWTKEPIKAGQDGTIEIVMANKQKQQKYIRTQVQMLQNL